MSKGRETGSGGGWSLPFFRKRAAFYYDGFNLYHAVDAYKRPYLKWLNLKALGRAIAPKSEVVKRVVWCSAFSPTSRSKLQRHEDYMKALQGQGVICRMGHFIHAMDGCNSCGHKWQISVEKQGDVNLALSIAADAEDDLFDVCYLVTADGDHAATARYLKERFPKKNWCLSHRRDAIIIATSNASPMNASRSKPTTWRRRSCRKWRNTNTVSWGGRKWCHGRNSMTRRRCASKVI